MRTKILILLLAALTLTSCNLNRIRGNGQIDEIQRELEQFSSIDVSGSYDVKILVGKSPSILIKAEENLIDFIETEVINERLRISNRKNLSPTEDIELIITTNQLDHLESSGANDINAKWISGKYFSLDFSGAGSIILSGKVKEFEANVSGAGSLNAKDLKTKYVDISISGAASAKVFAYKALNASVSGVASIDYYGNPEEVNKSISGLATLTEK